MDVPKSSFKAEFARGSARRRQGLQIYPVERGIERRIEAGSMWRNNIGCGPDPRFPEVIPSTDKYRAFRLSSQER